MEERNWKKTIEWSFQSLQQRIGLSPPISIKRTGRKPTRYYDQDWLDQKIGSQKEADSFQNLCEKEYVIRDQRIITATSDQIKKATYEPEIKFDNYGPFTVENVMEYPYSAMGRVVTKEGIYGTGCLIGPNIVVTSAHICFNIEKKTNFNQISFIPATFQDRQNFQGFSAKEIYIPLDFKKMEKDPNIYNENIGHLSNYALIVLDNKIPGSKVFIGKYNLQDYFGSLSYDFDWQDHMTLHKNIQLYGYLNKQPLKLTKFDGKVFNDKYFLLYSMQLQKGMSGAPVILYFSGCYWVIGIHQGDASSIIQNTRAALKLTKSMFHEIQDKVGVAYISYDIYDLREQYIQPNDMLLIVAELNSREQNSKQPHNFQIKLGDNNLGIECCKPLADALWNNMQKIDFQNCHLQTESCKYMSKAKWKLLINLNLKNNNIRAEGCNYLSLSKWSNLQIINLQRNKIGTDGCKYIATSQWSQLRQLNLQNNNIGAKGCQYISQTKWNNLTKLLLSDVSIGAQGSKWIASAHWRNLRMLSLTFSCIGNKGCQFISKAHWKKLLRLSLCGNHIKSQGLKYISRAQWNILQVIDLQQNNIEAAGCNILAKLQLKNLNKIIIKSNPINLLGFSFLKNGPWKIDRDQNLQI